MKLHQSEEVVKRKAKGRLLILIVFISFFFFLLLSRVWYLQIIKGSEYIKLSENNRARRLPVKAFRGKILDINGQEIVNNRPSFNLVLIPEDTQDAGKVLDSLGSYFEIDKEKILKGIKSVSFPFQEVIIKKDINLNEVAFVEENKLDLPGISLRIEPFRNYIFGEIAPHLLGYLREIAKHQISKPAYDGYLLGDLIGQYGIEKNYEKILRGKRGKKWVEMDAAGREIRVLKIIEPEPGNNIFLTIDIELQKVGEKLFEGKVGAMVVMDVTNGDILTYVSKPTFDPNFFSGGVTYKNWKKLINDPLKPLQNRVIQGLYPPGSVYKIITAAAALEEGIVTPETMIDCPGHYRLGRRLYRCWKRWGHGKVNLRSALKQSCDVYFYTIGYKLGIDKIGKYAFDFGLGAKTGIELEGEKKGIVPTSQWKLKTKKKKWIAGETISCAIGQGYNLTTPLQLAVITGAIANDGVLWKPNLVKKITLADGGVIEEFKPEIKGRLSISKETIAEIKAGLFDVVNGKKGTGRRAKIKNMNVSGKTGTSQVVSLKKTKGLGEGEEIPYEFKDHALFVGYAPSESPKIVVSVIVEHGGYGGRVAAPMARKVIEKYFDLRKK